MMLRRKQCATLLLDARRRLDGRKLDEIRPIWSEVDYLPTAHGSAIFTRGRNPVTYNRNPGSTHEQLIDGAMIEEKGRFLTPL